MDSFAIALDSVFCVAGKKYSHLPWGHYVKFGLNRSNFHLTRYLGHGETFVTHIDLQCQVFPHF